jgi:hypothetical protein
VQAGADRAQAALGDDVLRAGAMPTRRANASDFSFGRGSEAV